jgi:hypothetical protein
MGASELAEIRMGISFRECMEVASKTTDEVTQRNGIAGYIQVDGYAVELEDHKKTLSNHNLLFQIKK